MNSTNAISSNNTLIKCVYVYQEFNRKLRFMILILFDSYIATPTTTLCSFFMNFIIVACDIINFFARFVCDLTKIYREAHKLNNIIMRLIGLLQQSNLELLEAFLTQKTRS